VPLAPQLLLSRLTRALLLELVGNLVDAGLGADLVARTAGNVASRGGGRPGNADRADDFVSDLDRQAATSCAGTAKIDLGDGAGILGQTLGQFPGGSAKSERGIGLALAVLKGVRRGAVVAQNNANIAAAIKHDQMSLRVASCSLVCPDEMLS